MEDNVNGASEDVRSPETHPEKKNFVAYLASLSWTTTWFSKAVFIFFTILILSGAFLFWMNPVVVIGDGTQVVATDGTVISTSSAKSVPNRIQINCSNSTQTCSATPYNQTNIQQLDPPPSTSSSSCPDYFRWIHHDLDTWRKTGITRETLELAKPHAHFRLVILQGKVYVETYDKAFQTRDVFTIWGILQLLRLYPGQVPDLELMFNCHDKTEIFKRDYQGENATWPPPPLFHYCGSQNSYDIVFPDWSFWGWPEVNVRPWNELLEAIVENSKKIMWKNRLPYAFWRGNPRVSPLRKDLMKCQSSFRYGSYFSLYAQDWSKEIKLGFKNSNIEDQCIHRYKIYVEGRAWSVSEKYILACDSMTLLIKPDYYDFFIRGMSPMTHYWPISPKKKCKDITFAVNSGNKNTTKAQSIGKAGSGFIQRNLSMNYVYDYMLYSLREYAKLLKFKVEVPSGAEEMCAETMACREQGLVRQYMESTIVMSPSQNVSCILPPAYNEDELQRIAKTKENIEKQIQKRKTGL